LNQDGELKAAQFRPKQVVVLSTRSSGVSASLCRAWVPASLNGYGQEHSHVRRCTIIESWRTPPRIGQNT
ncbi:MAG: hypothetical protein K6U74_15585, partial [Firmicutes bacterium]|nr:hypothetical protein [Bacillota bacterium]